MDIVNEPIELEVTTHEVTPKINEIELCTNTELEISGLKKEYAIIGDSLYAGANSETTPQWLANIIDSVVNSLIGNKLTQLNTAINSINTSLRELEVAKNQYQELINIEQTIDGVLVSKLETLNATVQQNSASIIDLDVVKTTADEALAITIDHLNSEINNGEISSLVTQINSTIANNELAAAQSIEALETVYNANESTIRDILSTSTGEYSAEANAITELEVSLGGIVGGVTGLENTLRAYMDDSVAPLKESGIVYRDYSTFVIYYPAAYDTPYTPVNATYPTYALNAYYGLGQIAVYELDPETLTYAPANIPISSTSTERLSNLMDFSGTVYKLINISNQYVYQQYITPLVSTDDKYILLTAGDIVEDTTGTIWIYNGENLKERKSLWVSKVESSFKYSSVLRVNNNNYITGFSLQSELIDSGNGAAGTSEFVVQADKFKLVDPDSGNNVTMTEEGLVFSDSSGNPYKYLSDIRTAVCTNGVPYTLSNIKKTPAIVLSPKNMPVYHANNSTQNQSVIIDMTDIIDNTQTSNTYTFTPRIMLVATDGAIAGNISGDVYDTASVYVNSSSTLLSTAITSITINTTVKSVRSTGVSGTYYYRKCISQLQKSLDNTSWTNVGTPVTTNFGASIGSLRTSLTYTGAIAANTYVRVVFTYSNTDGSTFSLGAIPYEYHTLSGSIGTAFAATGSTWATDIFGACVLKRSNVTQGSAYYINNTQACRDTYGSRAGHQYYCGNGTVHPPTIRDSSGFSGWEIYSLTVTVTDRAGTGGSLFLGYGANGSNAFLLQSANNTAITTSNAALFTTSYNMLIDLNSDLSVYKLADSAVLNYTIELKRIVTASTTEQNSVYDIDYSATASGYSALLEGTVSAIMIS